MNGKNELKIYRVICNRCFGDGEVETVQVEDTSKISYKVACGMCHEYGYILVDWIELLKTPKELRIDDL